MELLVNDLSLHGQFPDAAEFQAAIQRVMSIRASALRFGHALYCHRNLAQKQVTSSMGFQQAIQGFNRNEQRVVMQWITQQGPFWEDAQEHNEDDYLDWNGEVVTGTAVGEAAYCCQIGIERHLVSLQPSNWLMTPVPVTWTPSVGSERRIEVANHWEPQTFETDLASLPAPVVSWTQLAETAIARCQNLKVYTESFEPVARLSVFTKARRGAYLFYWTRSTASRFASTRRGNALRRATKYIKPTSRETNPLSPILRTPKKMSSTRN